MFKIKLQANFKNLDQLEKFKNDIRKNIIENGLDETLDVAVLRLKEDLKYQINQKMPDAKKEELSDKSPEAVPVLPKSDEDIIKHITGVDISKIRRTKDYTTSVENNVIISKDFRLKLRFPIGPSETFDENYSRAKSFFNSAIYVFSRGVGNIKYLINPGIDLSEYVKVVCSTDVGDTDRSREVFKSYRDSNKRPRQANSEIGRYAEWSLKQEGMKRILNSNSGFIDITSIVKKIKDGNIEEASDELKKIKPNPKLAEVIRKVDDLKTNSNLNPNIQAYTNILKLLNSLAVSKLIKKEVVIYTLVGNDSNDEDTKDYNVLYDELMRQVKIWIVTEERKWFEAFVSKAKELINLYSKAS